MVLGLLPYGLVAVVVVFFGLVWSQPDLVGPLGWVVGIILVGLLWRLWEPRRLGRILWPWLLLVFFWVAGMLTFLFFDTSTSRLLWICLLAVITWWYSSGWLANQQHNLDVSRGAGVTATLVIAWLSLFFTGVAAVSWLIFLDAGFWWLFTLYAAVTILTFVSVGWTVGWTIFNEWPYLLVASLVQLEAFIVFSWWPTNVYLIGWLLSAIFLALFMFTRYDTSVAMPRQTLVRNLLWLIFLSIILIASSRWF